MTCFKTGVSRIWSPVNFWCPLRYKIKKMIKKWSEISLVIKMRTCDPNLAILLVIWHMNSQWVLKETVNPTNEHKLHLIKKDEHGAAKNNAKNSGVYHHCLSAICSLHDPKHSAWAGILNNTSHLEYLSFVLLTEGMFRLPVSNLSKTHFPTIPSQPISAAQATPLLT